MAFIPLLIVPIILSGVGTGIQLIANALTPRGRQSRGKIDDRQFFSGDGYGRDIPEVYGGVSGSPDIADKTGLKMETSQIWAKPIRENRKVQRGGKGGPKRPDVEEYTYYGTWAVAIGRGPLRIRQVYLNEKLVFDRYASETGATDVSTDGNGVVSGVLKIGGGADFRLYPGNEDQDNDPTIESTEGIDATPGYLGLSYAVFTNVLLTDFGNSIPRVYIVAEHAEMHDVATIMSSLALRSGLTSPEFDFSDVSGFTSRGIGRFQRSAPRETLDALAAIHGFYFTEDDGVVYAKQFSGTPVVTIPASDLGAREDAEVKELITTKRIDQIVLPQSIEVRFYDGARDYESNQVYGQRFDVDTVGKSDLTFPANLLVTEAQGLADRELYRLWGEKDEHEILLPYQYGWLRSGQVIEVDDDSITRTLRIDDLRKSFPAVLRLTCRKASSSVYVQPAYQDEDSAPGGTTPPTAYEVSDTLLVLANLPQLRPALGNVVYAFGAPEEPAKDWRGALIEVDRGAGFVTAASIGGPSQIGTAAGTLGDFTGPGTDTTNTLEIDFLTGSLANATSTEVEAGANWILVGNEVLAFETATQVIGYDNRWEISDLHRGLARSENAKAGHGSAEYCVLLDGSGTTIIPKEADAETSRDYRVTTAGQPATAGTTQSHTWHRSVTAFRAYSASDSSFTASWVNGGTATARTLYYRPLDGTTWSTETVSTSATSKTVTGLDPGTAYECYLEDVIDEQVYLSETTVVSTAQTIAIPQIRANVRCAAVGNVNVASPGATHDGLTLSEGDSILLSEQTAGAENGLYIFNGATSALTRREDADDAADFEEHWLTAIREGTSNGNKLALHTTVGSITLGTTAITFKLFEGI